MRLHCKRAAILVACAVVGCEAGTVPPGPQDGRLSEIAVAYVCGNDFDLENRSSVALTVRYSVIGTFEMGELVLPAPSGNGKSTTRLTTLRSGALQISYGGEESSPLENPGTPCPPFPSAAEPRATEGEWTPAFPWPVVAVHLHLLPSGRVLSWGRLGVPQLWDPTTGAFTEIPSSTMVFCSGHAFLPDGKLLVTGGHLADNRGLADANIFDGATQAWTSVQHMGRARWYPTSTTLSNGEVLTLAGTDEKGIEVDFAEVWTGGSWRLLPGARKALPYYPRTFLAPNGLIFYAGELQETAYLDPTGAGKWTPVALSNYGRRDYGSAVMYRPGKVLIVGGSDPPDGLPTNTAEVIDLAEPVPSWRYTGAMNLGRRQFNATILPDGQVLVTGGTSARGFSDRAGAVYSAEVWNPRTEEWTVLADNRVARVYHSTTLLLPDGRVLHAGSGDGPGLPRELNAELFSPPYLFRGTRPVIASSPAAVGYGARFFVATPEAGQVVRATFVRLSSVTHGFDQNQRFLELDLQKTAGGVTVTSPASSTLAPPGDYMLFIVNGAGVPSIATTVRVG
jgi:hypothetical protein